jgi:hypothetical protein
VRVVVVSPRSPDLSTAGSDLLRDDGRSLQLRRASTLRAVPEGYSPLIAFHFVEKGNTVEGVSQAAAFAVRDRDP